jgi:polyisoprenoid-binding protein YceI
MKSLRSFIPPLAVLLLAAGGAAAAEGVLIDRSEIRFVAKQLGANVEGRFRKWKANVDFRPKDLAKSKADFDIELASIDLANEETESELRGPEWFATERYPVAKFRSTAIRNRGDGRYEVSGTLSMKGITKPVTMPVTLRKDSAGHSVAEGQLAVQRLDFKVGEGLWADTATVANEVVIRIRMVLPALA